MTDRHPTPAAAEFGEHLTALHIADGEPSFGVMSRTILLATDGAVSVSDQQLGNYHAGRTDPRRMRVEVLVALCRFYDCEPAKLGPTAAAEVAKMMALTSSTERFDRSGWLRGTYVQGQFLAMTG
jgi:hypothetical protein